MEKFEVMDSYVSPAHAGIGRLLENSVKLFRSLPRTRGDRPTSDAAAALRFSSPPHTRGSALTTFIEFTARDVSPAHAGIGLSAALLSESSPCLPRTRGDRPAIEP